MENITEEDVVKALGQLSVMELIALTRELEQKWGVKAEPPKMQLGTQESQENSKVEVQTEFNVILASYPADKKMSIIKMIREVMTLGLKEAKDFVESAPKMIKEAVSADEAETIKAKLVEAGAVIEVK